MPKMKTKKALKSRFKVTGRGKLMRRKQGRRHIMTKKTSKSKRQSKNPGIVLNTIATKFKKLMGEA